MSDTFTEADLEPSDDDRRRARHDAIDRGAATVAVVSAGLVVGGLVALGACAAPFVFRLTPAPASGFAMGAAFARFDRIAIGAAAVALGAELVRTFLVRRRPPTIAARLRRFVAMGLAGAATWMGTSVSPAITDLYAAGARREAATTAGPGADLGASLDALHRRAEAIGKLEVGLALALVALHVFTVRRANDDDDPGDVAPVPLPPGPRA